MGLGGRVERGRTCTCSREEVVAILVEGDSHDPVSQVERLLHAVTMMNVDINVQHTRVIPDTIT